MNTTHPRVALVTGFPDRLLAVRVVQELLSLDHVLRVRCIVRESQIEAANLVLSAWPTQQRERVRLLVGDSAGLDLGLSGAEFKELAKETKLIHHCASNTDPASSSREAAETVNATNEVLELAELCDQLERLVHWSSTIVSGAREGLVMEGDLENAHGFRTSAEKALYRAEAMIREIGTRLPITVLRPASLVGDSVTGETDLLHGPYVLIRVLLNSPEDLRMPAPVRQNVRVNFIPIDYAVKAGIHIAQDSRSLGRTFHVVDPKPLTVHRAFELFAEAAGKPIPKGFMPTTLATRLMRTPGLDRWVHTPRAFLENVRTDVIYDDRNARELLEGSGIRCPALEDYVDTMVDYVQRTRTNRNAPPKDPPEARA